MGLLHLATNSCWAAANFAEHRRFARALHNPRAAQLAVMDRLIKSNEQSFYGRQHRFAEIRTYEAYASRVPIVRYEDLEPLVNRIRQGEQNILTSGTVTRLVPTSGSRGPRKFIPYTRALQAEFSKAVGVWIADLFLHDPKLMGGPAYWSITPALQHSVSETSAIPIGFDTDADYLGGTEKFIAQQILATVPELALAQDLDSFRFLTLYSLLRQPDLRLISVWHPSFFTLLLETLASWWPEFLEAIATGCSKHFDAAPPALRRALNIKPLPQRAKTLAAANPKQLLTIWPHLRLISCWGDAAAQLSFSQLEKSVAPVPVQAKGLLATEGVMTIPFRGKHIPALRSHFYEFLDSSGSVRLIDQLTPGERYEVILSSGGGLWRYRIGDFVQASEGHHQCCALRFVGRGENTSDQRGEKLSEEFVATVLSALFRDAPEPVPFAVLAPEISDAETKYVLYMEGQRTDGLAEHVDRLLCENPHYALCRKLGQLHAVEVRHVTNGYRKFVEHELAQGKRLGDIKPLALITDTGSFQSG